MRKQKHDPTMAGGDGRKQKLRGPRSRPRPMSPSQATNAVEAGLIFLARRSYPEAALREKLDGMWGSAETDAAIARLRELGMIDDDAWARRYTRNRFERGGNGRHRIIAELAARGIAPKIAADVVAETVAEHEERRSAETLLAGLLRRHATHEGLPASVDELSQEERARIFRTMVARGYPSGLVRDLLDVS
ncbi:MAG TPA: regulatory protein RecX [Candidatus Limnocylindrales bacterium]|nr:regulatory protein RecX [Candidatus Limnocylindrales bacterium]